MALKLPKQYHPDFSRPGVKPTGAVEVDWSNPLARGLSYFVDAKIGYMFDVVQNTRHTSSNPAFVDFKHDQVGSKWQINNGQVVGVAQKDYSSTDSYTISFLCKKASATANAGIITGRDGFSTNFIWLRNDLDGVRIYRAGGQTDFDIAGVNNDMLLWRTFVVKNGTGISYHAGGKKASTTAAAKTFSFDAIASGFGSATYLFEGDFYNFVVHDRALSDAEILALHEDPYQILRPAQPMMLFLPAGGTTGYTLNADVNANTLGSDDVSLLANRTMTADVNSLALGADGVTLSSGITLVADVNTLTVGGDDVALTANRLIGADVNALTLGSDGVDLTAGWTFSADVNSLTLGGDDVTLTYTSGATYTLTADAGAYTVSSDGVDLLANRLLTADARAYILSADSVTLSVGVVDTEDCYVWLQSQITDVAYTVSAINVNNYLVSDVDDTAQYLSSAFGAEAIYLESCICHCA